MKIEQKKTFFIFTIILLVSIYSLLTSDDNTDLLRSHIYNCNYAEAISLAELILQKPNLPKEEKIDTYLHKGIAEYSSHRILDSKLTFTNLLLLDNKITLNQNKVSPKIIELFNDLKISINQNNKVKL